MIKFMKFWYNPSFANPVRNAVVSSFFDSESIKEKGLSKRKTKKSLINIVVKSMSNSKKKIDRRYIGAQIDYMADSHYIHYSDEDSYVFRRDDQKKFFLKPATLRDHLASFCMLH